MQQGKEQPCERLMKGLPGSQLLLSFPLLSCFVKPLPEERHPYVETADPEIPVRNVQVAPFVSNELRVYKDLPAELLDCVCSVSQRAPT